MKTLINILGVVTLVIILLIALPFIGIGGLFVFISYGWIIILGIVVLCLIKKLIKHIRNK